MNYREVEIMAPKDLGTTGTEVIDIKISDVLTSIELIWQTTVATVSDMTAPHAACISKVEIIDGSDVLTSLSGEQLRALAFHTTKRMPLDQISVVAADYMRTVIPINFGRKLFDPQLAFVPTRFKNPQLKITWDEDAANASVVANELNVRAWAFDEKVPSPVGFLMAKEIKSYTPVANGYAYTPMPTDHPYRMLLMQSESTDKNPFEVLNLFKLSENHDKRIPLDLTGYEIFRKFIAKLGRISETVRLNETAADAMALYLTPTYLQDCQVAYDADVIAANDDYTQPTFAGEIVTIAATVSFVPYRALVSGYAPHFCFGIPFGDLEDMDDWYDVTKLDHLLLTTQGAAAVGTSPAARICLQQLRKY